MPGKTKMEWADRGWNPMERLKEPLRWRKSSRIFVNSMGDLFHELVPASFIRSVFSVMAQAKQHTFMVLTKRPAAMQDFLSSELSTFHYTKNTNEYLPLRNVWLGVSAENQSTLDQRIHLLLTTPAAKRFISVEPLLGWINFDFAFCRLSSRPDWVIVGGESGVGARRCEVDWIRYVVKQCQRWMVPVFVKQLGSCAVNGTRFVNYGIMRTRTRRIVVNRLNVGSNGQDISKWPIDLRIREFPW